MAEHLESDLGTAAFLVVRGFRLLGLTPNGAGRYAFRFEDTSDRASEAALAYMQGEAVSARALVAAMSDLKTLLYSKKEPRHGTRYRER